MTTMGDLVPSPAYDFTKYKPGDVLVLRMKDMQDKAVHDSMDDLMGRITVECRRRGIGWTIEHDEARQEIRIRLA